MKTNHVWSVLCRRSSIDQESNTVSLFDVVEEITIQVPNEAALIGLNEKMQADGVPFPFEFEIVSLWENLDGKDSDNITIVLKSPSGDETQLAVAPLAFNGNERLRQRTKVGGVMLKESGRHEILIRQPSGKKDKIVARLPITFKLAVLNG